MKQGINCKYMKTAAGIVCTVWQQKQRKKFKIGEWISCSERLPENEWDVEITYTIEHYLTGEKLYLTARAFHEDGTLTTEDSAYNWEETDNWEIDEETDSCIVPAGWYESVSFTEEFGIVDKPVIAWRPIAKPYKPRIDN